MRRSRVKESLDNLFMIKHQNHNTIESMEGLRAFAAFMVFLVHYAAQALAWVPTRTFEAEFIFYIRYFGATGVDFFFILSGYLIYGMLINKDLRLNSYIKRRLKRIYPTFLSVMFVYLILSFIFPNESKLPGGTVENTIYILQCLLLLPGVFDIKPIMSVAWTLSYEMLFYLLVPIVITALRIKRWPESRRVLFLVIIAVTGFYISLDYPTHVRMLMFVSGMLIFELKKNTSFHIRFNNPLLILILTFSLMFLVRYHFSTNYKVASVVIMFFGYGTVCLLSFNKNNNLGKLFSHYMMRWFGNMSYSYYLIHGLTLKVLFLLLSLLVPADKDSTWVFYFAFFPFFIVTIVVSVFLFILIERPFSLTKR